MKLIKFLFLLTFFLFFWVFLLGAILYVIFYFYSNYKKEIIIYLRKYPELEHILRKVASFVSIEFMEYEDLTDKPLPLAKSFKPKTKIENLLGRQKKILEIVRNKEKFGTSDLQTVFPKVNVRTLRRDLSKLESLGYIVRVGKTKGSFYKIV